MTVEPRNDDPDQNEVVLPPTPSRSDRILSIQSHVAFGYVGGKAAVFPLQCMGYDVDLDLDTNELTSFTGYGRFGGTKTTAEELARIFDAMQQTGVLVPDRLLTGYIPSAESLGSVHELVKKLRISNPSLIYLLDPVLGDSGKLYVSENCISVYRQMLPLATIITPNWFEVEMLTEVSLTDLTSLRAALRKLHDIYCVRNVVISSIPSTKLSASLPSYLLPPMQPRDGSIYDEQSYLICIASSVDDNDNLEEGPLSTVYASCVELIPGYFSGVGDLFSALLLGHFHTPQSSTYPTSSTKSSLPLAHAVSHTLSRTHAILTLTHESASTLSLPSTDDDLDAGEPERQNRRMKGRELKIVQGQDVFRRKEWDGVAKMQVWEGFWSDSSDCILVASARACYLNWDE
ncbi:Ribokinase-like protein [Lanmaoa asiatica]|nr:Ribokinase-like protein [Lanmaoa asiatica]